MVMESPRRASGEGSSVNLAGDAQSHTTNVLVTPAIEPSAESWDAVFSEWKRAHHAAYEVACEGDAPDTLADAEGDAWLRLMFTPAPHCEALTWKLDYLFSDGGESGYSGSWRIDIVEFVIADAKRLAAAGEAR